MNPSSKKFLYDLLHTPSPTGFETKIQRVVKAYVKDIADTVETDLHGNLIVGINTKAKRRVMLAGHCDQIGFMVNHISKDGFIYVSALGGIDVGVLQGAHVVIQGEKGPVEGIIGRKPIHHQSSEERSSMKLDLSKLFVDIGAKNKKEAEKRVSIGDCATFKLGVTELGNDFIVGPGLDDKVGLFIAMETLRACAKSKISVALYAVSTVQEEVGLRGAATSAFGIDPEVGIALDVCHAMDNPTNDNPKAIPCALGGGPAIYRGPNINPVVDRMLFAAAKKWKIPHQPYPASALLGNDARAIQGTRGGVAAGSIGIPNRYMHTQVEMCSIKDLELSVKLLSQFVKDITPKTDFRPS